MEGEEDTITRRAVAIFANLNTPQYFYFHEVDEPELPSTGPTKVTWYRTIKEPHTTSYDNLSPPFMGIRLRPTRPPPLLRLNGHEKLCSSIPLSIFTRTR